RMCKSRYSCRRTATAEFYTLSLHDALPICAVEVEAPGVIGALERRAGVAVAVRTQQRAAMRAAVVENVDAVVLAAHQDHRLGARSEEHTSELQSRENLVCRLLLEKKKN